ncbi:MAG: PTS sugar transporter subunit IIB [Erysipelotrichaceae bacterium]|jgi:PTS system mannose-specific IIB component|nr:PTS sugar transporter subunit IIB [Erysipelotrichaceae bacterium]
MIKHLRIDNRLIHGQVAVVWMGYIGAPCIIVSNDKVAADPIQKMALPLAARGKKVLVFSNAETIQYTKDHPDEPLFVIAKNPADALEILESGVEVEEVNVGNAAPVQGTKYTMVTKAIAVTADDAVLYRKIAEMRGGKLKCWMIPTDQAIDFIDVLKNKGF